MGCDFLFKEYSKDRIEIENKLTEQEIRVLANSKDLKVIQISNVVEESTFEMLNDLLFSIRDDVVLRKRLETSSSLFI